MKNLENVIKDENKENNINGNYFLTDQAILLKVVTTNYTIK